MSRIVITNHLSEEDRDRPSGAKILFRTKAFCTKLALESLIACGRVFTRFSEDLKSDSDVWEHCVSSPSFRIMLVSLNVAKYYGPSACNLVAIAGISQVLTNCL